jgi:hypothetical protein
MMEGVVYTRRELSSLLVLDPGKVVAAVCNAYKAARCSLKDAAGVLGCNYWTLLRWVKQLDERGLRVTDQLDALKRRAEREGWHHGNNRRGGRHPKAEA